MRKILAALAPLAVASGLLFAAEEKASEKIVYETKQGTVTFLHEKHSKRQKEGCKACHDKLWPQKKGAALGYKAAVHKTAEAKKTSCGTCHHPGGPSFESKGNCVKCHAKKGAAPAKTD
jgi:c(7)-type cytochrome triheme protein